LHFGTYTSKVEVPSTNELSKSAVKLMKACIGIQPLLGSVSRVPLVDNKVRVSFSNVQNIRDKIHASCFLGYNTYI
jgi:hypothetical protein